MQSTARMVILMLALALPAKAQEPQTSGRSQGAGQAEPARVEIDTSLICDTQQQVERFVTLLDEKAGSAEAAIDAVNEESGTPDACVIATAAFRRAGVASTVTNSAATFDITRIVVLGVYTVTGLERAPPTEFFTLLAQRAEEGTVGRGQ